MHSDVSPRSITTIWLQSLTLSSDACRHQERFSQRFDKTGCPFLLYHSVNQASKGLALPWEIDSNAVARFETSSGKAHVLISRQSYWPTLATSQFVLGQRVMQPWIELHAERCRHWRDCSIGSTPQEHCYKYVHVHVHVKFSFSCHVTCSFVIISCKLRSRTSRSRMFRWKLGESVCRGSGGGY